MNLPVKNARDGARFMVHVAPGASRTALTGVMEVGDEAVIRIALNAPPVKGKANAVLIRFLGDLLGVPRSDVQIAGGVRSRKKLIAVRNLSAAEAAAKLEEALDRQRSV